LAAATALADAGADVVLTARTEAEVEAAACSIRQAGNRARAIAVDVSDIASMRRVIAETGPFAILINNVGTNHPAPFVEVSERDFDAIIGLNLRTAFFVAQAVVRGMIAAGTGGVIVNLSSQMGHVGAARRSVYCASKHGLEGLTKAMAIELADLGIRVNTLCPTFIETPMTKPFLSDPGFAQAVKSKIKLGRVGFVEDLMGGIIYLCSDAAALVTGSALLIDGGWTAD
jgi:NAD(P)-dependent dehydrogenase (short-subunit alcohol dehydrogenase family)